ncbi:ZN300 protein, partial [Amia calva]|nr:ZN300 protein [Amia calva]
MSASPCLDARLASALTGLLRAALWEIGEAVAETVSEHRAEITRRDAENEALRRRLQELLAAGEAAVCGWSSGADGPPVKSRGAEWSCGQREGEPRGAVAGAVEASVLPDSGERAPVEQQSCEQEWDSSLKQDPEPTATEGNQWLSEQSKSRPSEEKLTGQESGHMAEPHTEGSTQGLRALGSDTAGSMVMPNLINNNPELAGSTRTQCGPSLVSDHIKTEDETLESVYAVEPRTQTVFRDALSNLKIENIADSACDLGPELPVAGQCDLGPELPVAGQCGLGPELPVAGQCDPQSAALKTGLSGGSDSAVSWESPSSQCRQLRPRLPRLPSSSSSPSSPLRRGKQRPHHQPQSGKDFTGPSALIRQHSTHTGVKSFHCAQCGKSFCQAAHLITHQHTHTGERPFCCVQCGKRFSNASNLNKHKRIHTGERPYCCVQCGKSFAYASNFKAHQRSHTGERPYSCVQCGKRFTYASNLNAHQRIHTGKCSTVPSASLMHIMSTDTPAIIQESVPLCPVWEEFL